MVSEPGTFTETTCAPKLPGTFDYSAVQNLTIPFTAGTERTTLNADVNGDDRMDLVFNERSTAPPLNRVHVALAGGPGTFTLQAPWTHPANPTEGWENYDHVMVADVDGDGSSDLAWNALTPTQNAIYTAISLDNGSYSSRARQERPAGGWNNYHVRAGDLDGDGQDDLTWTDSGAGGAFLRTYYALAQPDTTFYLAAPPLDQTGNYGAYAPQVLAQFDGAAGSDYVLNAVSATFNHAQVARFTPSSATLGSLTFATPFVSTTGGWQNYRLRVGNVDGQNAADLIWVESGLGRTYVARNTGNGTWLTNSPAFQDSLMASNVPFVADFNNDGRSDLMLNSLTASSNQLKVGFGASNGTFTFPAGVQTHPAVPTAGWATYSDTFLGDVNGDGKADVVWTSASGTAAIYVAIAR